MTTTDTPPAPSADTPESVAARVEEALETCAARPSIAAAATGLLSNFIGCVEKGRGTALDAGDGRAARFALDLLARRDRAQAVEIARLSSKNERQEAALSAERAQVRKLAEALASVMPLVEEAEKGYIVGNEGCLWSAEFAREAVREARAAGLLPEGEGR